MPRIIIKGTPIDIPNSGASPNWSPAIIEGFQAIADAVNSVTATFDVAPQAQNIDANNSSINVDLNNLSFPSSDVRAATIYYTIFRKTDPSGPPDGQEVTESGTLELNFNNSRPVTEKWELVRSGQGDGFIDFNITDIGQVRFSTTALTGINHTGIVAYRAITITNV